MVEPCTKAKKPSHRFRLRFDKTTPEHDFITIFVNGGNAGSLCLKKMETTAFSEALRIGCEKHKYIYEVDLSQIEEIIEKTNKSEEIYNTKKT